MGRVMDEEVGADSGGCNSLSNEAERDSGAGVAEA